jgi:tripartite-type tricarboxylate transporter receptor subunit TctC
MPAAFVGTFAALTVLPIPARWAARAAAWAAAVVLALGALHTAQAAAFPVKPMRIIVPFPPGAFNDQLARLLAQKMGETWKQPVMVDNRPGAGTVLGTDLAAKAPADGHTLLVVSFAFAVNPSLMTQLPYDTRRQFTPVALAAGAPNVLVVHPSLPVRSVPQLLDYARRHPGELDYATAGHGTSNHLCAELFKSLAKVNLTHVPYKGSAPAVSDLLGGQVKVMFDNAPNVMPHVKAGKLRALAVTTAARAQYLPGLPSIAETVPGYDVEVWFGVVAPARTPKAVVATLNAEINRILALPEVRQRFAQQGVRAIGGTPEQFGAYLDEQMTRWAKVVKEAGVRIE